MNKKVLICGLSTALLATAAELAPHDKDDWQEDILGQDTLPDDQSVDIKFHRKETAAVWDLRIEDKAGHGKD